MNPWDIVGWLTVGTCSGLLVCALVIIAAAFAMWARSRAHVHAWLRDLPEHTLWRYGDTTVRVRVYGPDRVTVCDAGDGSGANRVMNPVEFAAVAKVGSWRLLTRL